MLALMLPPDQTKTDHSPLAATDPNAVVVTLVHGTFARGTAWTQDGSTLREWVLDALKHHDGQDGAQADVIIDVFEWSGRNTHKARVKAGHELADHIRRLRKGHPDCRHFIVAHSHGGNIALLAHKHLSEDLHATGVATLGTPFVYARPEAHIAGKSLADLENEAPKHTDSISGVLAWVVGIATALTSESWLKPYQLDQWYWEIGSGVVAGFLAAWAFQLVYPYIARFMHRFGGKRAAAKLASAVGFPALPNTHLLSFIYPGDEAQRFLD
ncbi:MAG: hypothetical protein AAFO75_13335, partial [Pseudomonadota bacterium]